jgi:hypothetical protein
MVQAHAGSIGAATIIQDMLLQSWSDPANNQSGPIRVFPALPSSWPAGLPVPNGEILLSASSEGTSSIGMNTTVSFAEAGLAELLASGFSITQEQSISDGAKVYILESDSYSVSYAWADASDEGVVFLQYGVTPKN